MSNAKGLRRTAVGGAIDGSRQCACGAVCALDQGGMPQSRVIPRAEHRLRRTLADFVAHCHGERNHQGLGNELIDHPPWQHTRGPVHRRSDSVGCSVATIVPPRSCVGGFSGHYWQESRGADEHASTRQRSARSTDTTTGITDRTYSTQTATSIGAARTGVLVGTKEAVSRKDAHHPGRVRWNTLTWCR